MKLGLSSFGLTKRHMVMIGSFVILFSTYLIVVWRGWKPIKSVRVADILPNEADAVVVAMFAGAAGPAGPAGPSTGAAAMVPNVAQGASAPGAAGVAAAIAGLERP
jgi:hypothetical protein